MLGICGMRIWNLGVARWPARARSSVATFNAALVARRRACLRAGEIAFHAQAEPWPHLRAEDAAEESSDQPQPAVDARGRNSAEICTDIAAVGQPRAVAEHQSAEHRGK